jgi:hypothetical protein
VNLGIRRRRSIISARRRSSRPPSRPGSPSLPSGAAPATLLQRVDEAAAWRLAESRPRGDRCRRAPRRKSASQEKRHPLQHAASTAPQGSPRCPTSRAPNTVEPPPPSLSSTQGRARCGGRRKLRDPPPSSTPELMPALRIPPRRLAPAAATAGTPAAAPPTTAASGAPGCDGERGALLVAD